MLLADYIKCGPRGERVRVLAAALRVPAQVVSSWSTGYRLVPVRRCVAIERETGRQVMRWDLRPLDWHEIWPELIGLPGAPPLPQSVRLADAVPHAAPAAKEAACHD